MSVVSGERVDKDPERNKGAILAADASRLAALLVGHMRPACSLLAPCDPGASAPRFATFVSFRVLTLRLHDLGASVLVLEGERGGRALCAEHHIGVLRARRAGEAQTRFLL